MNQFGVNFKIRNKFDFKLCEKKFERNSKVNTKPEETYNSLLFP